MCIINAVKCFTKLLHLQFRMFTPLLEKTTYHRNMPASNAKRPVLRQRKTIEQMSVEIIQSKVRTKNTLFLEKIHVSYKPKLETLTITISCIRD